MTKRGGYVIARPEAGGKRREGEKRRSRSKEDEERKIGWSLEINVRAIETEFLKQKTRKSLKMR